MKRQRNVTVSSISAARYHLITAEIAVAKGVIRNRDATAILVAYRHGLRASELAALRWDDIDLATGRLHVRRAKSGDASVHPISARESRALRKLLREAASPHTSSSRSVARRCPQPDISAWLPGRAWLRNSRSSCIPTCCGMPAASSSPTTATTRAPSKPISATDRSCPRSATGLDAEPVQKLLEGLTFQASRINEDT